MTFLIIKSFLPEFFLSFCILGQLIYNPLVIVNFKKSFPILTTELFLQTIFILICLLMLLFNLKCEVFFLNFLFINNVSSILIKFFTVLIALFILLIILKNFVLQKLNFFEYFIIYLLSLLAALLLISATDMLSAYLVIEMQAFCFYILTSFNRDSAFSTEAGLKYFISGAFISGIFLAGCSGLYGLLGTLNFNHISLLFSGSFAQDTYFYLLLVISNILILSTFLFKLASFPFHFWAPDVYEGAPLASTIILSLLPKFALIYFFIKWLLILHTNFNDIFFLLEIVSVLSLIIGIGFALKQKRLKRLMIYSSIGQLGFILAALSSVTLNTLISVLFFLIIYILSSLIFWLNLSIFYSFQKSIRTFFNNKLSPLFLISFSNLFKVNKSWSFSLLILFFSIAGLPPFAGFFAKIFIIYSLIDSYHFALAFSILIISIISAFYYLRFLKVIFFEPKAFFLTNNTSQIIFSDRYYFINCFLNSFLLFFIVYLFINPTFVLLICHQIIVGLYFF